MFFPHFLSTHPICSLPSRNAISFFARAQSTLTDVPLLLLFFPLLLCKLCVWEMGSSGGQQQMDLRESPRYFTFFRSGKAIVGKFSIVFFAHFFPWEFVGRRPVVCLNKKCDLCPLPSPLCWPLQRKERKKTEMLKNCFPPLLSHKKDGALRLSRKVQKTCSERVPKIQRLISRVFILFRVLNN